MAYSHYENMDTSRKDDLADGVEIRKSVEEYEQKRHQQLQTNATASPKRRHNDSDNDVQDITNDDFKTIGRKKTRQLENSNGHVLVNDALKRTPNEGHQGRKEFPSTNTYGRGMVIFNSQSQRKVNDESKRKEENARRNREEVDIRNQSRKHIPQHVLNYAVNHQLPPIKINCQPGVRDQQEGTELIKILLDYIQEDFRKLNRTYSRPLGFDTWYVDKQGALLCFTRDVELFVYLWDVSHYPPRLSNTTIAPVPPIHLPPQHSIIFKFVPKTISVEELLESISDVCQSKFTLEEMKGSITNRSRHMRLDLTSKDEVTRILNSGVFPIAGHLLEVTEFLAPPQILICSRCNCPGHVKKECKGPFDRCRRCGLNKTQGDHRECDIKCHHCNGDHLSTDYRCPIIVKYRSELIEELKKRPELLPKDVQLFVPVQFRNGGKNYINGTKSTNNPQMALPCFSQSNDWPILDHRVTTSNLSYPWGKQVDQGRLDEEMKTLKNDYEILKMNFEKCEKELVNKHENYKNKLGSMLNLLVLQNNQQNECITKIYTVVNELVPVITNSLKSMHIFIEKMVNNTEDVKLKNEFNRFQLIIEQNLSIMNDRNDLVIEHQRATTVLNERTNALFRQGIDLISSNEQ